MSKAQLPELIEAMMQPDFYPHETGDIELVQTHISWVILTGDYVYKVKKPVNFGFLDFTTPEKRQYFCEQELRLNRRLAPELYLDVLPISRQKHGFCLGGTDKAVEYCLKLLQFEQADLLDRRLAAGSFDPEWMDQLAIGVAGFHQQAETSDKIRAFGDIHFIQEHVEANLAVAKEHIDTVLSQERFDTIQTHCDGFFAAKQNVFSKRQSGGHIRACHGDLHLRNITLFQGRPCVFDCIEFNDEFRMIDSMNDVAFLAMDCDARERPDLGFRFLSRYLECTADYDGLELLPLYLSYRAGVRGKVACLLAGDPGLDDQMKRSQLQEASDYFALAETYATADKPQLIAIGGLSGSGKSHLALAGCGGERAIIIRTDATRKRLAKDRPALDLYGPEMNAKTYSAMFKAADTALRAGFSVILDATFVRRQDRDEARRLAQELQLACRILWLDVPEKVLRDRVSQRKQAGRDVSDADLSVLEKQLAAYRRPHEADIEFVSDSDRWPDRP